MSRSVLEVLDRAFSGIAGHRYIGTCPDPSQPDSRDPKCPACVEEMQARATVERMAEALAGAMAQMEMAGDCIEARRYDEALLHVRSLDRQRREALAAYHGDKA